MLSTFKMCKEMLVHHIPQYTHEMKSTCGHDWKGCLSFSTGVVIQTQAKIPIYQYLSDNLFTIYFSIAPS